MLGRADRAPRLDDPAAGYDPGPGDGEEGEHEEDGEDGPPDALTWRLAEAARARAAADRTSEGERGDFDLAPNGLPVDRRERSAFADLLREIGHDAPGPEPGRED